MRVCIDAGHGGNDTGAEGPTGLEEANTALAISLLLADKLERLGYETLLTRSTDVYIELGDRCDIANDWGADYFISVHLNSNGPSAKGIETLFTSPTGYSLGVPIQEALIEATDETDRGMKERDDLYVLNGTSMPAVLLELGFISHPSTEEKFRSTSYQELLATAITEGICEFLEGA